VSVQQGRSPFDARNVHPVREHSKKATMSVPAEQAKPESAAGGFFQHSHEVIHGKRSLTPNTALRLERLLGMGAQFWLNLQLVWDLYHAIHSPASKEIKKIRRIPTLALM